MRFVAYLDAEDWTAEQLPELLEEAGLVPEDADPDEWIAEVQSRVGKPFRDVTLTCELDVETGAVRVLRTELGG